VNPALPLVELELPDVRRIFPGDFVRRLRKLYACGNYGDPMVARDTLPIFEHLQAAEARRAEAAQLIARARSAADDLRTDAGLAPVRARIGPAPAPRRGRRGHRGTARTHAADLRRCAAHRRRPGRAP